MSSKSPTSDFQSWRKTLTHLTVGGIAGAISRTAVAPIERTIILKQTKNPKYLDRSIFGTIHLMFTSEGALSLFKGNGANVVKIAPFQAIEFFTFELYKHTYKRVLGNLGVYKESYVEYLFCGALAGMTASSMTYPLDLMKTILAVQTEKSAKDAKYHGIFRSLHLIYKEQGFFALYRGLGTSLMGIAPYASLKLTCFQVLKNSFYGKENKTKINSNVNLALGAISGCFAATITYPSDLLRRRLQIKIFENQKAQNAVRPKLKDIAIDIWRKDGFRGFFFGLIATYLKVIPSTALAFAINEKLKDLLGLKSIF